MGGFRPKLSTMIKYLNLSRFEKRLFGDQTPPQTHGYPRQAYVRALLVKIILGFGYRDLVAFLSRYRGYKRACGFGAGPLPHFTRFSAFFQKFDAEILENLEGLGGVDAVIFTVAHHAFAGIGLTQLRAACTDKPVLFDIRGRFNAGEARQAGFIYRSL